MGPLRLALLLLAAAGFVPIAAAQQPAPPAPPPASGPQMLATARYLFVIQGDRIHQFDIDTLKLLHSATLPKGSPQAGPVAAQVEEVEVLEEGEEAASARMGAGGRYGGREPGRGRLGGGSGKATAKSIERALEWLKAHQDEDGKWDSDGFMKHDVEGEPASGAGNPLTDVGVTGLSLLAFLADGNTMRSGPYRDVVRSAVRWLREQQDPNTGLFGTNAKHDFIYDHAIATFAMVEAYGLSNYTLLKKTAQRGIDYLESHRNPYSVWRYQPRDGENDTSVTSWCLQAYAAARDFRLDVNPQVFPLTMAWVDSMTDPATGRVGYTDRGGWSSRMVGDHAVRYPREENEAMTAAGLWMRFLCGQSPEEQPIMRTHADLILQKIPTWNEDDGSIDGMAWLYGSLAMYQMGGRHWSIWEKGLGKALLRHQRSDGNFDGSWDPVGVWGEYGGRVFTTALHTLSLQTYYRYTRLIR